MVNSVKFLGAAGTVTGSSYQLLSDQQSGILIDLGMFQGREEINELNMKPVEMETSKIKAVILTHAHLDHCGRLPLLLRLGFNGPIYMTEATRELVELSLLDAAKVAREHNHNNGVVLFTEEDVKALLRLMVIVEYDKEFVAGPYSVTLRDAGHILGSASVEVKDKKSLIIFSGDLGNTPQDLIKPTEFVNNGDVVIMESTYGDRIHAKEDSNKILQHEIRLIEDSGGTLLIPAFSLERTQEILHRIDHLKINNLVKSDTRVFLDSPMGEKATMIFKAYKDLYNTELFSHSSHDDPFSFPGLMVVESAKESAKIGSVNESKVIIAGSGMMSGGRILNHAINSLPFSSTRLLFVGYQAEGTIGRKILDGAKEVRIYGQQVEVNAHITEITGLSSHADKNQLINWLKHIKGVKKVFLVHGEDGPRTALKGKIQKETDISDIVLPQLNNEIEL